MEDIARLSKEANLAYYEMVICKKHKYTLQIHFANTQIHFANTQIHFAITQKETKLLLLKVKDIYLHPALFTVQSGLLSTSGVLMRQKLVGPCSFSMCILNLALTFTLLLSYIQIFTFLPSHICSIIINLSR